tara:strand:- start:10150 stop:10362 length:213 start_codon:yes stop_codon:yes gene_type:complete
MNDSGTIRLRKRAPLKFTLLEDRKKQLGHMGHTYNKRMADWQFSYLSKDPLQGLWCREISVIRDLGCRFM